MLSPASRITPLSNATCRRGNHVTMPPLKATASVGATLHLTLVDTSSIHLGLLIVWFCCFAGGPRGSPCLFLLFPSRDVYRPHHTHTSSQLFDCTPPVEDELGLAPLAEFTPSVACL
jgi:hypothetical protein